jgi:hypothetical protein
MSIMGQNSKSNLKFQLKGDFVSQKNVHYEIYRVTDEGTMVLVNNHTGKVRYSTKLKVGDYYVIKFMPVDNSPTKYLFVQALTGGTLKLNVDFGTDNSARLYFENDEYTIYNADPKKVLANL